MSTVAEPTLTLDDLPFVDTPTLTADPLGVAESLRPDHWAARTETGCVVVSYEACEAVLRNDDLLPGIGRLLESMGLDPKAMTGGGVNLLLSEGEEHMRARRVVSRWFTPRAVDGMRALVRGITEEAVDALSAAGGGDFFGDVARKIPGPVFCALIGAPPEHGEHVFEMSEILLKGFHEIGRAHV